MAWEWSTVATTIIGAGFGTAMVQVVVPVIRDARQRKRQAAYMAMRLAVVLEAYASKCLDLIYANDDAARQAAGQHEHEPDYDFGLPELPSYPEDSDGWRAIDRKQAERCLGFRNRVQESRTLIRYEFGTEGPDDVANMVDKHASARGLEAWDIAAALRRAHGVKAADNVWNYVESLREHNAKFAK